MCSGFWFENWFTQSGKLRKRTGVELFEETICEQNPSCRRFCYFYARFIKVIEWPSAF